MLISALLSALPLWVFNPQFCVSGEQGQTSMETSLQLSSDMQECFQLELVSSRLLLLGRQGSAEAQNLLENSVKQLSFLKGFKAICPC